jgi:cytochrome c-type biogenesis protein
MNGVEVGIPIAFAAGLLSFLSPCVLPLVPSYLTFVTGMSLEDLEQGVNRKATLLHSILFVLGFSLIFIVGGAAASFLGQFVRYWEVWIARIGGVVIILLGIHLSGIYRLTPLLREKRVHLAEKPAGYIGTLGVGVAFGAGWTPCLSPTLGAILTLGMTQDTVWAGVGLLSMYSLGLAVPFLVASLALDRFLVAFKRFRRWMGVIEVASGALLIVLGILLLTGQLTRLSAWLFQFTPSWMLI